MTRTPEQIEQIVSRSRHGFPSFEINFLSHELKSIPEETHIFFDYVPVRLVTITEACVRGVVRSLVDSGEPYRDRGINLIDNWPKRNLMDSLRRLSDKRLSMGDLVAHAFPLSSLSDIFSALGAVFALPDLKAELSSISERWTEDKGKPLQPIIADPQATFRTIQELFELRHVIVHEISKRDRLSRDQTNELIASSACFLSAIDWLRVKCLHDFVPKTQTGMNIEAGERAAEALNRLDGMRGGTRKDFEACSTPHQELEYHWDRFVDLVSKKYSGQFEKGWPGSIAPLLRSQKVEELTNWRIERYPHEDRLSIYKGM